MENRYYSLNQYLQEKFGEKIYKLSLDLGLTCPNRDGTKDSRGCIFCLAGSSHFAAKGVDIEEQIERAKGLISKKTKAKRFVAYFQSFTNTYAPVEYLRDIFTRVITRQDIAAISVATRPDCLPEEILDLLSQLNQIKPVWVELGLQTANEETAKYIRRCYPNSQYISAMKALNARGIEVVTHVIIGLPNETVDDIKNSISLAVDCGTKGIKLQLLHVLEGTDLAEDYKKGLFKTLSLEEYTDILCECLEILPPQVVVHRITGDAPKKYLISPLWSGDKKTVINHINRELNRRNLCQGQNGKNNVDNQTDV